MPRYSSLPAFVAIAASGALFASPLPATTTLAATQDAQTILEQVRAKQAARWATVANYTITLAVEPAGGLETPMHYEKIQIDGQPAFRLVPRTEYERRAMAQAGFPPPGPELFSGMADGYDLLGEAFSAGGDGMPPIDIRPMTSQMSAMMRMGAAYRENA
ncbi:MAG TPA: hypothetical protein VMN37_07105, partial [Gemmatimonadales bacterium]|nr:hypothetical protein [Gemmatimonadales bacterium]